MSITEDILKGSMTIDKMAEVITDMAEVFNVEIPSEQRGVDFFSSRMVGAATTAARHSKVLREYQMSHSMLMRS